MDRAQFAPPFFAYGIAVEATASRQAFPCAPEEAGTSTGNSSFIACSDEKVSGWVRLGFPVAVSLGLWATIIQVAQISI